MKLEKLISEIKQNWEKVLQPARYADEKYWDKLVHAEFAGLPVWKQSDIQNYGKSYQYEIIAHDGVLKFAGSAAQEAEQLRAQGGTRESIVLELSLVLPFYRLNAWRRSLKTDLGVQDEPITLKNHKLKDLYERAVEFAEKQGFSRVSESFLDEIVPGVALEENGIGEVTVYNCLFLDAPNLDKVAVADDLAVFNEARTR